MEDEIFPYLSDEAAFVFIQWPLVGYLKQIAIQIIQISPKLYRLATSAVDIRTLSQSFQYVPVNKY